VRRVVEIRLAAINEINIHPAIIVVIEKGATGAAAFRKILPGRSAGVVHPPNSTAGRGHLREWIERRHGGVPEWSAIEGGACCKKRQIAKQVTAREVQGRPDRSGSCSGLYP